MTGPSQNIGGRGPGGKLWSTNLGTHACLGGEIKCISGVSCMYAQPDGQRAKHSGLASSPEHGGTIEERGTCRPTGHPRTFGGSSRIGLRFLDSRVSGGGYWNADWSSGPWAVILVLAGMRLDCGLSVPKFSIHVPTRLESLKVESRCRYRSARDS
ncbi:hypothetical protein SODALDRAFT_194455 [Sodiomyces alkalinus F11]|uniref:Uncharacterized protein n=1 Tax=Sodiomyces alkalinus (strain CBS 110278 / VKM F-3762 / F11) TaxID=1314773 RepID=A0A3N2PS36_SODAK|nr:hypothetical protein SODALDRAFT_194455 [Sodiomyces alkalinus F11]ROT37331.1 hypothetical protein SODALDRAFT_194455 [Sodiomyces alkalinus F11]